MTPPIPPGGQQPPRGPRRPPAIPPSRPRPRINVGKPRGLGSSIPHALAQTPAEVRTKVLVVDDDPAVRSLLAKIVERAGYCADTAKDGGEAIQKIAEIGSKGYGLVLLDLMMPNIDGFDVIEHFKTHRSDLLKKTVVITASPKIGEGRVKREMVLSVVQKPFDVYELMAAIKGWLG